MDFSSVLTALRTQRANIDAAIVAIEALAPNGNGAAPKPAKPAARAAPSTGSPAEMKREAIRLKKAGSTAKEIGEALGISAAKASTLSAGVKRGSRAGRAAAASDDDDEAEADDEDDDESTPVSPPPVAVVPGAKKGPWI